jgi:succinyl-diaminopimelate desuccinylase
METFFKDQNNYIIKFLSDIVSQDTTNPPGNEYLAAKFVEEEFKKLGIPYQIHEKAKGRTNIIGQIGNKGPVIMLAAHLDVVPAGKGWDTPPFEPIVKGDRMWGRGSLDDKGLMASIMLLGKYLKSIEDKLNVTILIAGVADEETGSEFGMTYLSDENLITPKPDYAIIPDNAGNMAEINIAEKGHLKVKVFSKGLQAHAMNPHKGVNAINHLSRFLLELEKYEFKYEAHDLLDPPTLNVGIIEGGTVINSVPNEANAYLDIRYLPSQNVDDILNDFRNIVKKLQKEHKNLDIEIILESVSNPIALDPNNLVISTIKEEAKKFHGKDVKITGMGGGTVCKDLMRNDVVALCFSAGDHEFYHQVNENISISELVDYANIMAIVIDKLNNNEEFYG